jgi:hypothetical protein
MWKLTFSMLAIVAAAALTALVDISSIGASDSCGGCDASPAWVHVAWPALAVAAIVWLLAATASGVRAARHHRVSGSASR